MSISLLSISQSSLPRTSHNHGQNFTANKPTRRVNSRWGQRYSVIRCCNGKEWMRVKREKNYYELLGVSVDSQSHEIKQAYRNLQKKYHPDIAGQKGHEYTLLLNKAYNVLMREDLRCKYDVSIGEVVSGRRNFSRNISGLDHYSTWNGPLRSQALFVDENACIGCRDCVHHASKTFMMDESLGCARVKVQFGDMMTKRLRYPSIHALLIAFTGWTVKNCRCLNSLLNLSQKKVMVYLEEDGRDPRMFLWQLNPLTNNWNSRQPINTSIQTLHMKKKLLLKLKPVLMQVRK